MKKIIKFILSFISMFLLFYPLCILWKNGLNAVELIKVFIFYTVNLFISVINGSIK